MPCAYRRRLHCIGYVEPSKPKRTPVKKRSEMTEDEKAEADVKRLARKELKTAKDEWEKTLAGPWKGPDTFSWPTDTMAMYKSDAKTAFGLTESDMATLRHEAIQNSPKTFYALADVRKLATDKFNAGALPPQFTAAGEPKDGARSLRLFKKTNGTPNRRIRANWEEQGSAGLWSGGLLSKW